MITPRTAAAMAAFFVAGLLGLAQLIGQAAGRTDDPAHTPTRCFDAGDLHASVTNWQPRARLPRRVWSEWKAKGGKA